MIRDFPKHSFLVGKSAPSLTGFATKWWNSKSFFVSSTGLLMSQWDLYIESFHRIFPNPLKASEAGDCVESFNLTILALDIGEKVFGTPWNPSHEMLRDWTTSSKGVWMYRVRFLFLKSSNPMTDSDANQHALPHERAWVFWLGKFHVVLNLKKSHGKF